MIIYLQDRDWETSTWVRERATRIACFKLSQRAANPALFREAYQMAELDLAQARDGQLNIGLPTQHRAIVQTPMMDARFVQPVRLNQSRSTKVFSGQRLRYYNWWIDE